MKGEPAAAPPAAPMSPERWRQVNRILADVMVLPPGDRPVFLDNACGSDSILRAEVESLLHAANHSAWLDSPAVLAETVTGGPSHLELGPATIAPGKNLGPYIILRKLGEGGMGVVYHATDSRLGRPVALKLLSNAGANERQRSRFAREAPAASALNHPGIATIYEFDRVDGIDFIAMEYVEGRTLRSILHEGKTPLPQLLEYARQTARAVGAAHAAGVVHRDLKPANIMVKSDGTVKVLDFGLAKFASPAGEAVATRTMLTVAGSVMGTPAYMSPEQVAGEEVDFRADIFSFGILLYEMSCGKRPFEAPNMHSTLHLIATAEPSRVSQVNSAVPHQLSALIARCLRKKREERLQSLAEAERELAAIVAPAQPASRPGLSRRSILAAAGVFAVAGLGTAFWFLRPMPVPSVSCTVEISGPDGQPHPASFRDTFESGSRFRLAAEAKQPGYLYILAGDLNSAAAPSVLSGGSLPANRPVRTQWLVIEGPPGADAMWFVWSARPIEALDRPSNPSAIRSILGSIQPSSPGVDGGIELRGAAVRIGSLVEIRHR